MKYTRWIVLLLVVALGAGGTGIWAWAHRDYQDVVYYYRYQISSDALSFEVWQDPQRHWMRTRSTDKSGSSDMLTRDGLQFDLGIPNDAGTPYRISTDDMAFDARLLAGGLPSLYNWMFTWIPGQPTAVSFDGHPALRFDAKGAGPYDTLNRWFDARTHQLLGERIIDTDGTPFVRQYTKWERIPSGVLPGDFFTASGHSSSWWQSVKNWGSSLFGAR
jgi:hypothetical protein